MHDAATPPSDPNDARDFWRQVLHRWFVEYNPIYLVSAMLVLGGMIMTSRGLAREGSLYGPLGVAAIAEVYACVLIGGAALLTRIGQRRPAVMLALITLLYQSDLTLHTETCALLGVVGVVASAFWLALFVVKLYALAWAVQIRLAPRAAATAVVGAAGVTLAPYALRHLDARTAGAALAVFVFALGSLYPAPSSGAGDAATARGQVDDWHRTVLRRSIRATWIMWGVLLALHVLFWSMQHHIQLGAVVPALALLALRRVRTESRLWLLTVAALGGVFLLQPAALSTCSLLAAFALAQRGFSRVASTDSPAAARRAPPDRSPYRVRDVREENPAEPDRPHETTARFEVADAAARLRLLSGTLFGVYLSVWTFGWTGGALPAHLLALDAALVFVVALMVWRLRARFVLAPVAATIAHALVAADLVPRPGTLLEWGGAAVGLGFVLLVASLVTSYRLRHVTPAGTLHRAQGPPASRHSR